ncbi:hypothetical protein [Methylocystis heyeri]|uniref:DUF4239 domain-containing protein n=1 Tax=Methylocystis heyeri TaxID=391905 RepID=A0A6B8KHA5_9HYPH|nr:hypothetical protein [Methylocystis heyeri]QGM45873.1 hypothetical protein H2LOC_009255 [Methylocystis heyeri]
MQPADIRYTSKALPVNPVATGLVALLCFIGAALAGFIIARLLPQSAIAGRNRELIEEAREMLVALSTLTLGLIIASANSSFEKRANELENSAGKIMALDAMLAKYGPPAKESRELLRYLVARGIERIDHAAAEGFKPNDARKGMGINRLQVSLLDLHPATDRETWLRSSALALSNELASFRWLRYSGDAGGVQWLFVATMVFWLSVVFLSYGFSGPRNRVASATIVVLAFAMATAIEITLDLESEGEGLIRISDAPLRLALDQIGPVEFASPLATPADAAAPAAQASSAPPRPPQNRPAAKASSRR